MPQCRTRRRPGPSKPPQPSVQIRGAPLDRNPSAPNLHRLFGPAGSQAGDPKQQDRIADAGSPGCESPAQARTAEYKQPRSVSSVLALFSDSLLFLLRVGWLGRSTQQQVGKCGSEFLLFVPW